MSRLNVPLDDTEFPVADEERASLTGVIGVVDDALLQRLRAHAQVDDLPLEWTAEHVQRRLIDAYTCLARVRVEVGPRLDKGYWPAILREFADLVDTQASRNRSEEIMQSRARRLTSHEASLMEEALAWPLEHLDGRPLEADALTLFCICQATDREIAPILRRRKLKAESKARRMADELNAAPAARDLALKRRAIAQEIAAACNAALARAISLEDADAIRARYRTLFRTRCAKEGALPIKVELRDALPGLVLARSTLDKMRKRAAQTIAKRLNRASVPVR